MPQLGQAEEKASAGLGLQERTDGRVTYPARRRFLWCQLPVAIQSGLAFLYGLRLQQFRHRHPKSISQALESRDRRIRPPVLNFADLGLLDFGRIGKGFLRQPAFNPKLSYVGGQCGQYCGLPHWEALRERLLLDLSFLFFLRHQQA